MEVEAPANRGTVPIVEERDAAEALEQTLLAAARQGDSAAFERLVSPRRRELFAHCYRISGSVQDAEDALQESLVAAWRGLASFEGRSSLRTWLYQVSTHACLRLVSRGQARLLSPDYGPARQETADLGEPIAGPVWLEPLKDDQDDADGGHSAPGTGDPAFRYLQRESVELAFVAALQHLPATQRALLILREVLDFTAAETGEILDTTVASVNSALQRARQTVQQRVPPISQQSELKALGTEGARKLVNAFVTAWESADLPALLALLTEDARFTMPPLPAWFDGRRDVGRFFAERVFATPWRLLPIQANGQLGLACYLQPPGSPGFRLGAINVLALRAGRIAHIAGFLDPAVHRQFNLPADLPEGDLHPDR
jgi:RNA polymerase sigma-70 factor (TIGR02960 family)